MSRKRRILADEVEVGNHVSETGRGPFKEVIEITLSKPTGKRTTFKLSGAEPLTVWTDDMVFVMA